ncbi:hypothetical protein [Acidianus sp. HS-5]|nr:hypothetical protein [Acidianus sp. HS-5]BDC17456.1 hypothetical protein HS5_03460 [Acidianus sp. HS-5]
MVKVKLLTTSLSSEFNKVRREFDKYSNIKISESKDESIDALIRRREGL